MSRQPLFSEGDGEPVRISRTATGSAAMGAIATILFVSSGIVTASRFEQIFLALGVRIPHMSLWVLNPVVHVVIGALMLGLEGRLPGTSKKPRETRGFPI